jgi:outer membrane immunogenic protein
MKLTIRALLLGSAASLGMTGAALAADLRGSIPPPSYNTNTNWTGFYVGVNGGYAWDWGKDAVVFNTLGTLHPNPSGGLFGGQVGYHWQWTPEWVFGVETDFDGVGIFGSSQGGIAGAVQRVDMLGTLRGRAGYSLENVLLYLTGGLAYGRTDLATSLTMGGACGPAGFCGAAASTQWMVGWAAGAGFDWEFLPRWSFRTEYLHFDLGSRHQDLTDPAGVPVTAFGTAATFRGDIVRGAINFKFY